MVVVAFLMVVLARPSLEYPHRPPRLSSPLGLVAEARSAAYPGDQRHEHRPDGGDRHDDDHCIRCVRLTMFGNCSETASGALTPPYGAQLRLGILERRDILLDICMRSVYIAALHSADCVY